MYRVVHSPLGRTSMLYYGRTDARVCAPCLSRWKPQQAGPSIIGGGLDSPKERGGRLTEGGGAEVHGGRFPS